MKTNQFAGSTLEFANRIAIENCIRNAIGDSFDLRIQLEIELLRMYVLPRHELNPDVELTRDILIRCASTLSYGNNDNFFIFLANVAPVIEEFKKLWKKPPIGWYRFCRELTTHSGDVGPDIQYVWFGSEETIKQDITYILSLLRSHPGRSTRNWFEVRELRKWKEVDDQSLRL